LGITPGFKIAGAGGRYVLVPPWDDFAAAGDKVFLGI